MCEGIISGIVSGLIASFLVSLYLSNRKLKFSISSQICKDPRNNDFRVKIVNKSKVRAIDLKYSILVCTRTSDDIVHVVPVELVQIPISDIAPFQKDGPKDYAVRIAFRLGSAQLDDPKKSIIFKCYAKHCKSGTTSFFINEYKQEDIVSGYFETGESLKVIETKELSPVPGGQS